MRMTSSRVWRRFFGKGSWPLIVLVLTLVLGGVLALQAVTAARSHRSLAESTLADYAAFAAWSYQDHAATVLNSAVQSFFSPVRFSMRTTAEPRHPSALLGSDGEAECTCQGLVAVRTTFRMRLPDSMPIVAGLEPSDRLRAWIRDTIMVHRREQYQTTWMFGSILGSPDSVPRALVFTQWGRYVYGLEASPDLFAEVLRDRELSRPLLPPSLTKGLDDDSLVAAGIGFPSGRTVALMGPSIPGGTVATEPLPPQFGGLAARVALRPGAAEHLVIGGLPASRLPFVFVVFVLTLVLGVIAFVQLRRDVELTRLRADFATSVSHELRTPLAQIRMFLESLLLERTDSQAQQREYLEIADEEAKRLTNLVENVLQFSRAERRSARVNPIHIDLASETHRVVESFEPLAKRRNDRIDRQIARGVTAFADPASVKLVLLNLLDNAVKYGPAGQVIEVGVERTNGVARLWVRDEGPGVPDGVDRDRIWQPYVRLDHHRESSTAGTGIGLAVVREFVELSSGRVWVENAAGGGARFVVELPVADRSSKGGSGVMPAGRRESGLS
jgi:signal transduction histidine kinase